MAPSTSTQTTSSTEASAQTLAQMRSEVRQLIAELPPGSCDSWLRAFDPAFSAELGRRGWLGLTIPVAYGGHGAGYLRRYVVTEELLAAGAPVAYHWFADRQIGPSLIAHGNERLQAEMLPRICRGEVCVCIGISEPGAGSDVAAIATQAVHDGTRWIINGQKVWTTGAMDAEYCYLVARSSRGEVRHHGLSEFLIPMSSPGITVRPITDMAGEAHFAEIFFKDVVVEDWRLVGRPDEGFRQIVEQLDYERAGPERFLSTMPLLDSLLRQVRRHTDNGWPDEIGALTARLAALRAMAVEVAATMDEGAPAAGTAALVKDLGAQYEQDIVAFAARVSDTLGTDADAEFNARLREGLLYQATFTLRGGTVEILRDVIARRTLGLKRSS